MQQAGRALTLPGSGGSSRGSASFALTSIDVQLSLDGLDHLKGVAYSSRGSRIIAKALGRDHTWPRLVDQGLRHDTSRDLEPVVVLATPDSGLMPPGSVPRTPDANAFKSKSNPKSLHA